MIANTYHRISPHATATSPLTAVQVANAYHAVPGDGAGMTLGIIELGGAHYLSDLQMAQGKLGLPVPTVNTVVVDGATPKSDPQGADGEVALDIQVAAAVCPAATQNIYYCPNSDAGFYDGIARARADRVDAVSISWGGPESSWDDVTMHKYDSLLAQMRAEGIPVIVAAGDNGSSDGTPKSVADFPASSPNVLACGGTRLTLNGDGLTIATETVWDDSASSATGGGMSGVFPQPSYQPVYVPSSGGVPQFSGRMVPDVTGNADPVTGYPVIIAGRSYTIGGTSAVAPLYAAMYLRLKAALGETVDLLAQSYVHPDCFRDVTEGSNGAYSASPGYDLTSGLGVLVWASLQAALTGQTVTPPTPIPPTPPAPVSTNDAMHDAYIEHWLSEGHIFYKPLQTELRRWHTVYSQEASA